MERLWKFTKKAILNAQYYDTPQKFHQAIYTFFENINQSHKPDLQKLLTLKFQFFNKKGASQITLRWHAIKQHNL